MNFDTPLFNSIKEYSFKNPVSFHMPGHKLGKGLPDEFVRNLHMLDVTEIPDLDNLHYPQQAIKEAQQLAARAFGADETFFVVNGSTCGIHAIIMTICMNGQKLIVGRDCHISVINAMMITGAEPVFIKPNFNKDFKISTDIDPIEISNALVQNPDAVGVLITRPNYYGICSDIKKISQVVHSYDKILIVDEAHGSHLKFSSNLPESALESGADVCVQSAHKTLPALTQCAYVHALKNRIDIDRLKFNLSLIQTTSPSYILMASLDIARAIMHYDGEVLLNNLLDNIKEFSNKIKVLNTLRIMAEMDIGNGKHDCTRIVINTQKLGKSGFEIEKILRKKYNIQVEMSDLFNIVCISTVSDTSDDFQLLFDALSGLDAEFKSNTPFADIKIMEMEIPKRVISLKDAILGNKERINIKDAKGRICSGIITPYPPGIPVICAGEIINSEVVEYICRIVEAGGVVNGLKNGMEIEVVK